MKKYIAEFIGTFFLVVFGCGVAVATGNLLTIALAFGLVIVAMAYSVGNISGCHINPAVSLAMLISKKITLKDFWFYILSQTLGAITRDRLHALREADAILREEFDICGLSERVWQYFIAIPDIKSVGVKDESRYEGWPAIIRAVNTKDAMSATIEEIPYAVLHKITNRIVNEVPGINRVLYDLTPKPTGTIEWE